MSIRYVGLSLLWLCGLQAGGHVESAYAYIRNATPYPIRLDAEQETQFVDDVPHSWFIPPFDEREPQKMQVLGRVDTLPPHMRVTGDFPNMETAPAPLKKPLHIHTLKHEKARYLLITVSINRITGEWQVEQMYVNNVTTIGSPGYTIAL